MDDLSLSRLRHVEQRLGSGAARRLGRIGVRRPGRVFAALLAIAASTVACADGAPASSPQPGAAGRDDSLVVCLQSPPDVAAECPERSDDPVLIAAGAYLAAELGVDASLLRLVGVAAVASTDDLLGCGDEEGVPVSPIVRGYVVEFASGGQTHVVHASEGGRLGGDDAFCVP